MRINKLCTIAISILLIPLCAESQSNKQSEISGSVEIDYNLVQDDDDYLMPTVVLEIGRLHFEGRHNYEEKNSASFWAGYNFETGKELSLKVTPLAGVVIGGVAGYAPGLEIELNYKSLSLTTNSEYFINAENIDESFFYSWNELSISPAEWLSIGALAERTRITSEDGDLQLGLFAGIYYLNCYFAVYAFDPEKSDRNLLFAVGWEF